MLRFLLDGDRHAIFVKLNHTVLSRISYVVTEDGGSALLGCYSSENLREALSVEDIITKNQCYAVFPDKICADDKGIGQSSWLLLHRILKPHAQLTSVS